MTYIPFIKHFFFGFGLFIFSCTTCWIIIRYVTILDTPNQRSSHSAPTATIGGVAIVLTFFLGMGIIYFVGNETMIVSRFFKGFIFSSLLIACMSLYDDYKQKPLSLRLVTQIIAIIVVMSFGIIINHIDLPFLRNNSLGITGYVITFLWILGLTNAYNFMDGLNGMAAGNAVVAAISLGIISISQGSNFTYIVCYALVASTAGFLVFNFPKGKLFMGDVGSTYIGFTFATLAIISSLYDNAHTSLLVVPLLLFHFIYDTFFTFTRRFLRKENVFQAHRTHLYQLFNQLGHSHTRVTLFYCAVGLAQGLGAFWMVNIPNPLRLLVFLPFFIFQVVYSVLIISSAKKRDLL